MAHLELLVEEPSMEAFLRTLLPRLLAPGFTFEVHVFQGKRDLLSKLSARLRGYQRWLPPDYRLVVLVDQDDDDCRVLKKRLKHAATTAGLASRTQVGNQTWKVANRVVIEELEAWYFGDWDAVRAAYPRVRASVVQQARYRDPDAIPGGTWEAFERILQRHGYFKTGLRKIEVAQAVAAHLDPGRNKSRSFATFRDVIAEA